MSTVPAFGGALFAACGSEQGSTFNDGGNGGADSKADTLANGDGNGGILDDDAQVNGCKPRTCTDLAANCGPQGDGCGGVIQCGTCGTGEVCGVGGPSQCGTPSVPAGTCTPKDCVALGATCGAQGDGCGNVIASCGTCTGAGEICGGAGPSKCGVPVFSGDGGTCVPTVKSCTEAGANCGFVSDGCGNLLDCGGAASCTGGDICGGGGTPNVCGGGTLPDGGPICKAKTCAELAKNCGPVGDGCGGLIATCGTCYGNTSCGGGGTASVCGNSNADAGVACTNLCLQQKLDCPNGGTTSVSGTVFAPNGTLPIYNAVVYVPNTAVDAFTAGVTCDKCSITASGSPIATTTTGVDGKFILTNVPIGKNIPVVVQMGRWRRRVTVSTVAECKDTAIPVADTRLPKKQSEGDIPLLALTTGGADPLECILRKLGIDDSEFTKPGDGGRVNFYVGRNNPTYRYQDKFNTYTGTGRNFPNADTLWGDVAQLKKYDAVLFACEGENDLTTERAAYRQNVKDYLDVGGRVFATHWHRSWLKDGPAPLPTTATFVSLSDLADPIVADINTGFPKGKALADWLVNAGSSQPNGKLEIKAAQHTIQEVNATTTTNWVSIASPKNINGNTTTKSVQYFTTNTPVEKAATPADQCGRVAVSDIHISSGDKINASFPSGCTQTTLSDQEKALIFMLFDLTACVSQDTPAPPPTCSAKTCTDQGIKCGPAGNGCGDIIQGGCGTCPVAGETCGGGGTPGVCGGPKCPKKTCTDVGATCGSVSDGCGGSIVCGTCTKPGEACGGGGANKCGVGTCNPKTCTESGAKCGALGDGCGNLLACGDCQTGEYCGANNQCVPVVCKKRTCTELNVNCGPVADGCGGLLDCGQCTGNQTCGGGGTANRCGGQVIN